GRIDHQVKIRGFRVEPGEIEALLRRHPGVREATVTAREEQGGLRHLVAYVVPREGVPKPDAGELRKLVAGTLPEFLVPAAFVHLAQLPRTPSGKVDRRALPAPDEERADRPYAPPETETEELLVGIFAELLEAGAVGIYESFFDLGGHSLLAMRLTARVRDTFHVDLPLRELFAAPSVARLAAVVEELIIAQLEELSDEEIERLSQGI
ncbi:MAG: non-ribosomal peptide synthetase, partial [bacterium]|nr:non-ribosomal peptide synthetase [bacterium]